ncbi:hypothetical protein OC845_004986 [Tilletia horrida]|nr:hypothetical protein OC845_004986 [Tilletia horrida]
MRAATAVAARALLGRSIPRQVPPLPITAPRWTSTTSSSDIPSSLKGKQRQHTACYTQDAVPPHTHIKSSQHTGSEYAEDPESSKDAQARSLDEEALLEQCRSAHKDPDRAIEAYLDLRNRPVRLLKSLTDPKFERLCETIATSQRAEASDALLDDLISGRFGTQPGTNRRFTALQLLITRGFSPDGKFHTLDPVRLDRAFRLACEDRIALHSATSASPGPMEKDPIAEQEVVNLIDAQVANTYLKESALRVGILPKVLTIALVRRVQSMEYNDQNALASEEVLASLANQLYFHSFSYPQKRQWMILDPAELLNLFRQALMRTSGILDSNAVRLAQLLGESWRTVDKWTDGPGHIPSLISLAALSVKVAISTNSKAIPSARIIQSLHNILANAASNSTNAAEARSKSTEICVQILHQLFDALTQPGRHLDQRIQRLIWTFARFENTLLPHVGTQKILTLTGKIQAHQLAAANRNRPTSKWSKYHNTGRDTVATLLETALRSRRSAGLSGAASQEALISAIIRSPIFPIIFVRLSQIRRGDLVGSLLELMQLVPRIPNFDRPTGALVALSTPGILAWQGRLNDVLATDRAVIIQAAAQAKLRWHAAFLYHRWGELQLLRDNVEIFERFGRVIGESLGFQHHPDADQASSRVGFSLLIAERAAQEGVPLQSNPVIDSATCTWNMVKLFAASAAAPTQKVPLNPANRSHITTEWEFARLIEKTSALVSKSEQQLAKDITTRAATAFVLKDTDSAIQLLTEKLRTSQSLDEVDVGVMMAGIADSDIEAAVNAFLGKVQSSGDKSAIEADSNMDMLMQQVRPTSELFLMLISQSMFKDRSDLVARLLEEADERGMMTSAVLQSMEVILRQNVDLRPKDLLELIKKLTSENEWNPDPRILAWFCRCAARGQSLKEAMDGATRAQAQAADIPVVTPRKRVVGNLDDLIAAVGLLELSFFKYGYMHYHTAVLLIKLIPHLDSVANDAYRRSMTVLLSRVVQLLFHSKRIDKGAQQRSTSTDLQPKLRKMEGSTNLPIDCCYEVIRSYVALGDFHLAAQMIRMMELRGRGFNSARIKDSTFQPAEKPSAMLQGINVKEEVMRLKAEIKGKPRLPIPRPMDPWRQELERARLPTR